MIELFKPKKADYDRRVYVDYLRERIYGMITLMAVNAGMYANVAHLTVSAAFITLLAAAIGLWGAGMLSAYAAYRIAHDEKMPKYELKHEIIVHRALLIAAVPSLCMLALAGLDVIELKTALFIDIVLAVFATGYAVLRSAKTDENSYKSAIIVASIQIVLAAAIVLLKLKEH